MHGSWLQQDSLWSSCSPNLLPEERELSSKALQSRLCSWIEDPVLDCCTKGKEDTVQYYVLVWMLCVNYQDETTVMSVLVERGPLSIAINAMTLQFYHSGVWDPLLPCDPTSLDHAILLVGYGTKNGLFGKKPYWLIKNRYMYYTSNTNYLNIMHCSWGAKWGENGYFRLVRGKNKCGVTEQVTSAVLE